MPRVEAPLLAAARRGLPWRCRRKQHDWRPTLSSRMPSTDPDAPAEYRFSYKCQRCPATLHEVFQT